jgi:hypothetical protein
MNEYTKRSIDFAFDNKLSDMQDSIEAAIKEKVLGAIEAKKIEVAQNMFGVAEGYGYDDEDDDVARADRELARMKAKPIKAAKGIDPEKDMTKLAKKTKEPEDEVDEALVGKQHKIDKNKNGKLDAHDFKLLRKESEDSLSGNFKKINGNSTGKGIYSGSHHSYQSKHDIDGVSHTIKTDIDNDGDRWHSVHSGGKEIHSSSTSDGDGLEHISGVKPTGELKKAFDSHLKNVDNHQRKRMDESYIQEVLKVSDGVDAWVSDFVHSNDPKFKGKTKKERIQMALGAFYSAKRGKTNEEVEELDEISSKLAYRAASKRGERMSKAWRANDMDTFEKERGKAEKTYNIATKKAIAAEKKNPQKPEQSYPLGGYSRASNRSYSEEIEDIQELSKDTLQSYVDKRQWDTGANKKMQKKMDTGLARAEKKIKLKKNTNEEAEEIQELSKDTLKSYVDKRQWDTGANEKMQKKMDTGLARAEKKIKLKKQK